MFQERIVGRLLRFGGKFGYCPICEKRTLYFQQGPWLRDQYRCVRCLSIPRGRALIQSIAEFFPDWRELRIHESSPNGPAAYKLERECRDYVPTHFFRDVPLGAMQNKYRCENLEQQTFADHSFELVVTQDVFEHVLNPAAGFREVARTLKPGGAHVFTVPWYYWKPTLVRAVADGEGIKHLEPPDYHGNPIDASGSLVVTEWGRELPDFIFEHSGLTTTVLRPRDRRLGLEAEFLEVFISQKPMAQ